MSPERQAFHTKRVQCVTCFKVYAILNLYDLLQLSLKFIGFESPCILRKAKHYFVVFTTFSSVYMTLSQLLFLGKLIYLKNVLKTEIIMAQIRALPMFLKDRHKCV